MLALVVPVAKLARRAVRRRRGRPSDRMAGAWVELVDHARDLGIPVRVHASRPAQARVLARAGGLSREGDDGVFAEDEPAEAVVTAYWEQVMGERRRLGQGQRLRRRLWAPFNPVSFRRDSPRPINACRPESPRLTSRPNVGSSCGASRLPGPALTRSYLSGAARPGMRLPRLLHEVHPVIDEAQSSRAGRFPGQR